MSRRELLTADCANALQGFIVASCSQFPLVPLASVLPCSAAVGAGVASSWECVMVSLQQGSRVSHGLAAGII
jgi:hypothetical protein